MNIQSQTRKSKKSPKEISRINKIREEFQKKRPTLEELDCSGEYTEPLPLGTFLEIHQLAHELKKRREELGLSLADVAKQTGIDRAAISRLENGKQENPTVSTLVRYARAMKARIVWSISDVPPSK